MRSSKSARHGVIREIIERAPIDTQEQLVAELRDRGLDVTQATVSRDIREMGLVKVPTTAGGYRYSVPQRRAAVDLYERARRFFSDSVLSFDYSENLILIKTLPGNASAIGDIVDELNWDGIIGTLAGDDTVLVIVRPREAIPSLLERFEGLRGT